MHQLIDAWKAHGAHWYRLPPGQLRSAGGDGVLFVPVRSDLGVDVGARQAVEPALLGTAPGFLQPVGRRRSRADKILHAQDGDSRLAAPVDDEAPLFLVERSMICPNWVRAMWASMRRSLFTIAVTSYPRQAMVSCFKSVEMMLFAALHDIRVRGYRGIRSLLKPSE